MQRRLQVALLATSVLWPTMLIAQVDQGRESDIQQGTAQPPSRLIPQLTPAHRFADGAKAFPGHWAADMPAGTSRVISGVLVENAPTGQRALTLVGDSADLPTALRDALLAPAPTQSAARQTRANTMAAALAGYYGQALGPSGRGQLTQLYAGALQNYASLPLRPTDRDASLRRNASILTGLAIGERRLLKPSPQAQLRRYGVANRVARDAPEPDTASITAANAEALRFLRGDYIARDRAEASAAAAPDADGAQYHVVRGARPGSLKVERLRGPLGPVEFLPQLANPGGCPFAYSIERTVPVGTPEYLGIEGRAFVAAHAITGSTWEDLGLPTLYHTSVVVGRWSIVKTAVEVRRTSCSGRGAQPQTTTTGQASQYSARFIDWALGHGGAGTYKPGDELTEFYRWTRWGSTAVEETAKDIDGATADSDGKRCRARYAAYPVGAYGLNWVCHQAVNAFTVKKWNVLPVAYAVSLPLFGFTGNLGIADTEAPCQCLNTHANHACVPGNGCCWATTYGQGDGWGWGLLSGWHPTKGWINTEALFTEQPIPIQGWDEVPYRSVD